MRERAMTLNEYEHHLLHIAPAKGEYVSAFASAVEIGHLEGKLRETLTRIDPRVIFVYTDSVGVARQCNEFRTGMQCTTIKSIHDYRSVLRGNGFSPLTGRRFAIGHTPSSWMGSLRRDAQTRVLEWESPLKHRLRLQHLCGFDVFEIHSRDMADTLAQVGICSSAVVINPPSYSKKVDRTDSSSGDPKFGGICFVGSLVRGKGAQYLLKALRRVSGNPKVTVVGEGYQLPSLQKYATTHGLDVTFTGRLTHNEVLREIERCGFLCFPSLLDGFGLVVADAMAAGKPVVAFDAGGIRELVIHEHTGLLVKTMDTRGLATSIQRLIDEPALRRTLGVNAQEHVANRFSLQAHVERTRALLAGFNRD